MLRIAGINIPEDKQIEIGLTYIYGIGLALSRKILNEAEIDPRRRGKELKTEEVNRLKQIIEKEYKVLLSRKPDEKEIGEMIEGVESDNDVLRVVSVSLTGKTARVIMTEGKKREVKRLFKAFGIRVLSLKRIRIGNLLLGNLRPGEIRNIYPEDVVG